MFLVATDQEVNSLEAEAMYWPEWKVEAGAAAAGCATGTGVAVWWLAIDAHQLALIP